MPGSTFKTVTLTAGLDTGQYALDTAFSQADATDFVVNGEHIRSAEYNDWVPGAPSITAEQGYTFGDNVVFARMASQLGPDTWLNYVRRFGIATPGDRRGVGAVRWPSKPERGLREGRELRRESPGRERLRSGPASESRR